MFFGSSNKNKTAIICDIGSDSISISFVGIGAEKPKVFGFVTEQLSRVGSSKKESLGTKGIINHTLRKVSSRAEEYYKENKSKIQKPNCVYVTLSSPWFISETHKEKINFDLPQVFSREDLADLIKRTGDKLENGAKSKTEFFKNFYDKGSMVVENHLVDIRLNGYRATDPFNKLTKTINIDFFLSIIPSDLYASIKDLFESTWDIDNISIKTFPLVHFVSSKITNDDLGNTIHIDVTGGATEMTKIVDGSLDSTENIMIGKAHFRRALEDNLGVESFIATSMLDLYFRNELSHKESINTHFILENPISDWKRLVTEYIKKEKTNGFGCTKYVISSDDSSLKFFVGLLKEALAGLESKEPTCVPDIKSINAYNELVDFDKETSKDPFIALEAIYANADYLQVSK